MIMMKKRTFFTVLLLLFFASCSTKYNQRDVRKQRDGKWKDTLHTSNGKMIAIGKYKHGEKVGKWTYKYGDTLAETERYRRNTAIVKSYHSNGKLASKGKTKTNVTDQYRHWYKYGVWKYYDENGKLTEKPVDLSKTAKETTKEVDQAGSKELQDNMKKINKALNGGSN
ncbi:hypothetical protein BAY01_00240 [Elizabethkingia miricola]|nr:hypothetical protein BAY01_00240 [Elizabethkingia miricola]